MIGTFVEHNRKIFGAVQHSIIGFFLSIIGSALYPSSIAHNIKYINSTKYKHTVADISQGKTLGYPPVKTQY